MRTTTIFITKLRRIQGRSVALFRSVGLRAQLTALLITVLGFTLFLYSIVLYRNFQRVHNSEFDTALYNYTVDVARALDVNIFGEVIVSDAVFQANEKLFPFALDKTVLQLRSIQGKVVAKSRELGDTEIPLRRDELETIASQKVIFETERLAIRGKPSTYRVALFFLDRPGNLDFIVQVASPMILLEREERGLLAFFILSIPATLLIAGFAAYYFASHATMPILDIIGKAKAITAKKLNQRVPVPEGDDEIHDLAITLNELLDRLENAFRTQESFVADASHQLKTPLAILKGELDMIRKEGRSAEEIQEFLGSAAQEVTYLAKVVEDLLILARVEQKDARIEKHPVRLDETVLEVFSRMQRHALAKLKGLKIQISIQETSDYDFEVMGDPDLLRTLFESLVDNAIKYTRTRTTVTLGLQGHAEGFEVFVRDQGEGFTAEEREKLFQRFFRSPKVEGGASEVGGSGLGLSIARRIAELHSARIDANSVMGEGSQFSVIFPIDAGKTTPIA